ncbi:hypothetical protein M0R45_016514 [Rubus argutus]|uniref:Uncharacterized protein n=1 Tax=Rubus argutus TaxID=59490 RepID=A0AAW1XSR4_RUBAR
MVKAHERGCAAGFIWTRWRRACGRGQRRCGDGRWLMARLRAGLDDGDDRGQGPALGWRRGLGLRQRRLGSVGLLADWQERCGCNGVAEKGEHGLKGAAQVARLKEAAVAS